jgi:hypothetical protein
MRARVDRQPHDVDAGNDPRRRLERRDRRRLLGDQRVVEVEQQRADTRAL